MNNKRLIKELATLSTNTTDDYCIYFDENDINTVFLYIRCPLDSLYNFTFLKFKIVFTNYPFEPPKFTFLNHNSNTRIHPNLYGCGKVCLSLLNTFGTGWNISMSLEAIIYSILSILDNKPYTHEPDMSDCKEYNEFVRFKSIQFLLIDYLKNETNSALKEFITKQFLENYTLLIDFINSKIDSTDKKEINTKYNSITCIDYTLYLPVLNELYSSLK